MLNYSFIFAKSGFGAILGNLGPAFGPIGSRYTKKDPGIVLSALKNPFLGVSHLIFGRFYPILAWGPFGGPGAGFSAVTSVLAYRFCSNLKSELLRPPRSRQKLNFENRWILKFGPGAEGPHQSDPKGHSSRHFWPFWSPTKNGEMAEE